MVAAMLAANVPAMPARGDTPAAAVHTQPIAPGGTYPGVDVHSEGWFDVGGFCKVVDVGDLSTIAPNAKGVPVFIPGPATQWENYRTSAPSRYDGQLTLTTCCRPQNNIATICSGATNPQSVSREYGKLGEVDTVSGNCVASDGVAYTETMTFSCSGDNGPDGQAAWSEASDTGTPPLPGCDAETLYGTGLNSQWCPVNLPATPAPATVTVTITPTAANNWWGGTGTAQCKYRPAADAYLWSQPTVTCTQSVCPGAPSWTVGSYTCTANEVYGSPAQAASENPPALYFDPTGAMQYTPQTAMLYDENLNADGTPGSTPPASFIGGKAQATCNVDGTWTIAPGATCGPGQCVPTGNPVDVTDCAPNNTQIVTDSCGNKTSQFCVYVPPSGPTGPTACAPETIMSKCSVWPAYQCKDLSGNLLPTIYSDCGGECQTLPGETGGAPSTWPDANGTFTLPTCACTTGTHGGCPAWTGQATCSICN